MCMRRKVLIYCLSIRWSLRRDRETKIWHEHCWYNNCLWRWCVWERFKRTLLRRDISLRIASEQKTVFWEGASEKNIASQEHLQKKHWRQLFMRRKCSVKIRFVNIDCFWAWCLRITFEKTLFGHMSWEDLPEYLLRNVFLWEMELEKRANMLREYVWEENLIRFDWVAFEMKIV